LIRQAGPDDVGTILGLIKELATYERLADLAVATQDLLRQNLFGERRFAEALLAEEEGAAVGFALFFHTFSTFLGRPGLYLEDLFVQPEHRRKGLGRALLAELARVALARGCGRMEWAVLDWNHDAIAFYESLGAVAMSDWTTYRLVGADLEKFAQPRP
jgi:GNAT superfamily N-acetyltransferase